MSGRQQDTSCLVRIEHAVLDAFSPEQLHVLVLKLMDKYDVFVKLNSRAPLHVELLGNPHRVYSAEGFVNKLANLADEGKKEKLRSELAFEKPDLGNTESEDSEHFADDEEYFEDNQSVDNIKETGASFPEKKKPVTSRAWLSDDEDDEEDRRPRVWHGSKGRKLQQNLEQSSPGLNSNGGTSIDTTKDEYHQSILEDRLRASDVRGKGEPSKVSEAKFGSTLEDQHNEAILKDRQRASEVGGKFEPNEKQHGVSETKPESLNDYFEDVLRLREEKAVAKPRVIPGNAEGNQANPVPNPKTKQVDVVDLQENIVAEKLTRKHPGIVRREISADNEAFSSLPEEIRSLGLNPEELRFNLSLQEPGGLAESFSMTSERFKIGTPPITVYTEQGDVTKTKCDVFVCSNNPSLSNGSALARCVIRKAGSRVADEQKEALEERGCHLNVGEVIHTSAGNLNHQAILHTTGPSWGYGDNKLHCQELVQTVSNCLIYASEQLPGVTSIAIPAISAGSGGGASLDVAKAFVEAIMQFAHNQGKKNSLREICLIDIGGETVQEWNIFLEEAASKEERVEAVQFEDEEGGKRNRESALQNRMFLSAPGGAVSGSVAPAKVGGAMMAGAVASSSAKLGAKPKIAKKTITTKDIQHGLKKTTIAAKSVSKEGHTSSDYSSTSEEEVCPKIVKHRASSSDVEMESQTTTEKELCPICLDEPQDLKILEKCKHKFCRSCIDMFFAEGKPKCPVCGVFYGSESGNQPTGGTMTITKAPAISLSGYEGCGTITISYNIPGGIQTKEHPNPGKGYSGIHRVAYLPDNPEGNQVAALLRRAFDARLIFTVGSSRTTGLDNQVTWNDIHHKTNLNKNAGPAMFGYPDPTYLERVKDELAAKGIK